MIVPTLDDAGAPLDGQVAAVPSAPDLPFEQVARIRMADLRPAEQRVVEHLLGLDPTAPGATAGAIAGLLGVSPATVVNTVQRLGYAGFGEFRRRLIAERAVEQASQRLAAPMADGDPLLRVCRRVFEEDGSALALTGRLLDGRAFRQAVMALDAAGEVLCVGAGWSGVLARLAAGTFTKYGIRATGEELAVEQLALVEVGDERTVLLAISHRGRNEQLLAVVERARARGMVVIALTQRARSALGRAASVALVCAAPALPDELHPNQTGGPATHLTVVRALAEAVAWQRSRAATT